METKKIISLKDIVVDFDGDRILDGLNLDIHDKEFVTFLGPSGCGKTTTLRVIGGFIEPKSGNVFFDGKDITHLPPYKRQVNTVFQKYALFPHLNVFENVAFGLRLKKVEEKEVRRAVLEMLELVGLKGFERRSTATLSGGQQQRVAIARALAKEPQVLLLDEPLSNLDAKLRVEMREEIRRIQREAGITTIFVTHDQEEASSIADQVVLLREGVLQQRATARELYDEPVNLFAADFLGAPPINKLSATMRDGKILLDGSDISLSLPLKQAPADGTAVVLAVRAESICLAGQGGASLKAEVKERYSIGKDELVLLQVGQAQQMRGFVPGNEVIREGDCLSITLGQKGVFLFDAQTGERFA